MLTAALVAAGCSQIWCKDELKHEYTSPGGGHTARVVERNCGAMTHFLTLIELRERHLLFSRSQDVFQADNPHELKIAWQGENLLRIECLDCSTSEIREKLTASFGVEIEYSFSKSRDLAVSDRTE